MTRYTIPILTVEYTVCYVRVRGSVSLERYLDVRGIAASLGGDTLAAVRGHHLVLLQVNLKNCYYPA